jgi:isoquinoline 1-oxidoreductase beta subunit
MHALMKHALGTEVRDRLARELGLPLGEAPTVSRRFMLQSLAGSGLVLGFGGLAAGTAFAAAPGAEGAATGPLAPNPFVRIGTDNLVTVICKHHEMGQGNTTGLASMLADELDADWSLVRTEYAPADAKLYANLAFGDLQGTGGSSAIVTVAAAVPIP